MNLGFKNKTILVTGGSRGLGLEICNQFIKEGGRVFAIARNPKKSLIFEKKIIKNKVNFFKCDLTIDRDYNKLQNKFELNYINSNSNLDNIARSLAVYSAIHGDTNLINAEIEIYRSITKEEIRSVAKNLLDKNKRVILKYLPKK